MSEFLHTIEKFISDNFVYFIIGILFVILITLVIDILVVASASKKIKRFAEKYSKLMEDKDEIDNFVDLESKETITRPKTFVAELKGYPVVMDKETGSLKIVNDRPRDEKGRFVKRT